MNLLRFRTSLKRRLGSFISQYEKVFLALLSVVIVISGTFWYRQYSSTNNGGPNIGGTYVEGIIGSKAELETIAAKLTKAGLFYLDKNGQVSNLLVDNWQVNSDQTVYDFTIKNSVSAEEINNDLQANLEIFGSATSSVDGQKITIVLDEGNPNVPILLTQPLFDYGAYKLTSINDKTAIFVRSTKESAKPTYLNKIVVHAFADQEALDNALSRHKIDGAVVNQEYAEQLKKYEKQEYQLTRSYALILNTNQSPFRTLSDRKLILQGEVAPGVKSFTLLVPDEEPYLALADQATAQLIAKGVKVEIVKKTLEEVNSALISRNFEAVISGIDYGYELDPYYLWSSTQVRPPGNNISGVKSDLIDQYISRIRSNNSLSERADMIRSLNMIVQEEGAAKILMQEKSYLLLAEEVNFIAPFSACDLGDHWQTIHLWSVD